MAGVDKKLCAVEERKCEREQSRELFKQTFMMQPGPSHTVDFEKSISSDDERDVLNSTDSEMCESIIMPVKNKQGRKEIMTSRLASALDKCKVKSGNGKEISSAVYDTLKDWSMLEKVQAFVFDTTASNSGRLNGSCVLLEQMLNRPILILACRHHIFEIILQSVFSHSKLTMSGPEIPIFKRFKNNWNQIDQTKYGTWS